MKRDDKIDRVDPVVEVAAKTFALWRTLLQIALNQNVGLACVWQHDFERIFGNFSSS